ncbi:hypothetical protein [Nitrosopumilus sp.]|uniref:hypothetical protein n=1 Tax=Nitrosopumilus sp. TaxID=2024843 RepID=UPI0034A0A385
MVINNFMDVKKFINEYGLSDFPIGLGGCRTSDLCFDSCDYDVVVFDGKSEQEKIVNFDNVFVMIHHASLSETNSSRLLQYHKLQIINDDSWDLRMFLSKIDKNHTLLFSDFAKNCLIESQFCCQKTKTAIQMSDIFAPCWQKCATYYLATAIAAINHQRASPSHMLDSLRQLKKNPTNKHISVVNQTVGIERSTPILLERMLKSTIGFSDLIEKNNHSQIIQQKHDYFVKNSMLSDCYFYLGYVNKENFIKIKDTLNREQDLMHILKIAFDVEADTNLLEQHSDLVQKSCHDLLEVLSGV